MFIQPFEFESFLNKDWKKFIENVLFEAKHKAREALSMGGDEVPKMHFLPGDYTKDQKYLTQFHPETLGPAIKHRYSKSLLDLGKHYDLSGELPKDDDRANEFRLKVKGAGRRKKGEEGVARYRTYKHVLSNLLSDEEYANLDTDQKKAYDEAPEEKVYDKETGKTVTKKLLKIYTGHSHLGKALTAPAKIVANQHDYEGNEKFKPGPGLNDIKMHNEKGEVVKPDQSQIKDYLAHGHGPYDYDLSKVRMVPQDYYANMPDEKIVEKMSPKWKKEYAAALEQGPNWKEDKHYSKLLTAIRNTRAKLEEEPGHTMAGFEPIKTEKSTTFLTDWMRASALGLLGPKLKEGEQVKDPTTGEMVPVHLMKASAAGKYFGNRNLTAGFHPSLSRESEGKKGEESKAHPGEWYDLEIPVIPRWVAYEDQSVTGKKKDTQVNSQGHHIEKVWVPYLYDAKTIPHIPWTTEQKAVMAHRKNPHLLPGFGDKSQKLTPEELQQLTEKYKKATEETNKEGDLTEKARKLRADSTSFDMTNIMNNWDLLSPEQKDHIHKNARDLWQHAKAMHGRKESADLYSHANYSHGLGYDVNKSSHGASYLGIKDPEKLAAMEKKYASQMVEEATKGVYSWLYGSKAADAVMQGGSDNEQNISPSALVPQYVKKAMENITPELITIGKYYLLTFLNDYWLGIYDPSVGLSAMKSPKIIEPTGDPKIAAKNRIMKVYQLTMDISQAAISDAPPRRARGKFGHETGVVSSIGTDTNVADMTSKEEQNKKKDKKGNWRQEHYARRLAKDPGGRVLVNAKGALADFDLPEIAQSLRNRIKNQLGSQAGSEVDKAMEKATKRMKIYMDLAMELTRKYDDELASEKDANGNPKYTDEEREKLVDERVKKETPEQLAKEAPELFSNMTSDEREDLETRLKSQQQSAGSMYLYHDFEKDNPEYAKELDDAMNEFWSDVATEESAFIPKYDENEKKFSEGDYKVYLPDFWKRGHPVNAAEILKKMSAIYNSVAPNASMKTKAMLNNNMAQNAFELYKQILVDAHQATGKSDEQMKQELQQAGLGSSDLSQTEPIKAPQQAQPQVAAAAANNVDDVLAHIARYGSPAEFVKMADQLVANTENFKSSPNHAMISNKIFTALSKMWATRTEILKQNAKAGIMPNMAEDNAVIAAWKKLRGLIKDLA